MLVRASLGLLASLGSAQKRPRVFHTSTRVRVKLTEREGTPINSRVSN
jgi:hypothetical protein